MDDRWAKIGSMSGYRRTLYGVYLLGMDVATSRSVRITTCLLLVLFVCAAYPTYPLYQVPPVAVALTSVVWGFLLAFARWLVLPGLLMRLVVVGAVKVIALFYPQAKDVLRIFEC